MPTRPDIINAVMAYSNAVLDVEVRTAEEDPAVSPWVVNIVVTSELIDAAEKYELRMGIMQMLEPMRSAGFVYEVYVKKPGEVVMFGTMNLGAARVVTFFESSEEVKVAFAGNEPPPAWPQRSRFAAVAEELTAEVKPLAKPDPTKKPTPRAPQLFDQTIQVKERQLSPCPNCGCQAFEPNASKDRVTCRGCPLPAPTFALEKLDNWDFTTSRYKCSRCNRDSQVTMVMSDINLYCSGCGGLAIHTRQGGTLPLDIAVKKAKNAILKFGDTLITGFTNTPFIEEEVAESKYIPGKYKGSVTLTRFEGPDRAKLQLALAEADEVSDSALKESLEMLANNPVPNDWVQAIEIMQQRVSSEYGLTYEQLAEQTSSPAMQLFEMFRVKLGLQPFALYASTQRNENIMREGKDLPNDGRYRERRTGRTTKAMLFAIAEFMVSECNVFYVTGATERYTVDLVKDAISMHERLNLARRLPCRPLMPADVDPQYDYKKEKSYVFIDHSYYEKLALGSRW